MGEFRRRSSVDDSGVVRSEEEIGGPMATCRRGGRRAGRRRVPRPWRGVAEAGREREDGRMGGRAGDRGGQRKNRVPAFRIGVEGGGWGEEGRGRSGTLGSPGRRTLGRYPFLFLAKSSKPKGKTLFEYFAEKTC